MFFPSRPLVRFAIFCRRSIGCHVVLFALMGFEASIGQTGRTLNAQEAFSKYVDAKGNITLPTEFQSTFTHLGTIAVAPKAGADVSELHSTYTRPEDVKSFLQEGKFADGAILVKEVRGAKSEAMTTGHAQFADEVKIWFVMVKDAKGRFKDNDLWGDGWGWALFKANDPTKQVATDFRTDCRTCHVPAKANDWIYTQCYPPLKKAVPKSEAKTSSTEGNEKPDLIAKFPQWKEAVQLKGDVARGKQYFEKTILNTSLTCASCHSFDARDTMAVDGDGMRRAGFPIFAAAHRTDIKRSGTGLVALGADVCVVHFMKGMETGMTAQELADMDRFLHTGGGKDHPTARNIDYAHLKWTIPETLTGGDSQKGGELVRQMCITCHAVESHPSRVLEAADKLLPRSYKVKNLQSLALRVRNPEYKNNDEMPGYSDLRLSNAELLDILAWFTATE